MIIQCGEMPHGIFMDTSFRLILRNKIWHNYSLNFSDNDNIHYKLFPKQFSRNY